MNDRWLERLSASTPAPCVVRLLCFPYAGGGVAAFREWPARLSSSVEVWVVRLPGRGQRRAEPPMRQLAPMADAVADALAKRMQGPPWALFGHSMGALLAFEVARRIGAARLKKLLLSGAAAPSARARSRFMYNLPDTDFIAALRALGGTPDEVLGNAELLALVLPSLRADFEACETYVAAPAEPLACPLAVFAGKLDPSVDRQGIHAWSRYGRGGVRVQMFEGGHFFIHENDRAVLNAVASELGLM